MPDRDASAPDALAAAVAVPPDVLDRVVGYLNANRHRERNDWIVKGWPYHELQVFSQGISFGNIFKRCDLVYMPAEAIAVAVYCYGMPDPRNEVADA